MRVYVTYGAATTVCDAAPETLILDVLQEQGIPVQTPCGGRGVCGKCRVKIYEGPDGPSKPDARPRGLLACTSTITEGMHIVVRAPEGAIETVDEGTAANETLFAPDEGVSGIGMAVDLGTTTLVVQLIDLASGSRVATASRPNPQAAFGADVISRISACNDGALDTLQAAAAAAIASMRTQLCEEVGISEAAIRRIAVGGNTTMQHILAGLSPETIGRAPFTPLSLFGAERDVAGLGMCYFAPCIAGYVGGDIVAGMLARALDNGHTRLFIDIGTNGEMALAHQGRIVTCATAAGPVFEGGSIRFGMPAMPGAINNVFREGDAIGFSVLGDSRATGICGTGIIDAVALLVGEGIVDETGRMRASDELPEPQRSWVGRFEGETCAFLTPDHSICVTQTDVRNVQLAKAAICAGAWTLIEDGGLTIDDIESLEIAGGFGRFLDLDAAARIGLFPAQLRERALSVGNTCIEGVRGMLVSSSARAAGEAFAQACGYLELSTTAAFNVHYIDQMEFEDAD